MGRIKKRKEIWTPSKSPAQRVTAKKNKEIQVSAQNSRKALYQEPNTPEVQLERGREIIIKNCAIKGYHEFKVKPLVSNNLELRPDREYSKIHDADACVVCIPDHVPDDLRNVVTDDKRGLKLRDIEGCYKGLPCGHVPKVWRVLLGALYMQGVYSCNCHW